MADSFKLKSGGGVGSLESVRIREGLGVIT